MIKATPEQRRIWKYGTVDQYLASLTEEQLQDGLQEANRILRFAEAMQDGGLSYEDKGIGHPSEHMTVAGEKFCAAIDALHVRQATLARDEMLNEIKRRTLRAGKEG